MSETSSFQERAVTTYLPKLSFFEYFFVFVLIIFAGHSNKHVILSSLLSTPIPLFSLVLLSGILALKWRIVFDRQFLFMIVGFSIYIIAISLKFNEVQPTFYLFYLLLFFVVFSTVKSLRFNLFKIYEALIFYLAIVALFMWMVQILLGGDTLYNLISRIPGITLFSNVSGNGLNTFLYSVQPSSNSLIYSSFLPRNCGFAWEPGGFGVFICLALFCNLFINDKDRYSKIRVWVLTIALISTQSTTGYLMFLAVIFSYFYKRVPTLVVILFPVVLSVLVLLFSLPFMSEKIIRLIDETNEIDAIVVRTIGRQGIAYTPQRFSSFMITFIDFKNNPILGLGGHTELGWTSRMGALISPITGLGNLMAQFGLVGTIFFIIVSLLTSFYLSDFRKSNVRLLFFILIVFTSVSYSLILYPLIMCFWMFQLFAYQKIDHEKEVEDLILSGTEKVAEVSD